MSSRPNILFLMTDQMQGRVLEPGHPCYTPNFDKLIARGVRITRAYSPNPVCSPSRASLMTGLLPHAHGVLTVTHCVDPDQSCLRTTHPHWAQRLTHTGYRTGYFGKWHVERSGQLDRFGWQTYFADGAPELRRDPSASPEPPPRTVLEHRIDQPEGYAAATLYRVQDRMPAVSMLTRVADHSIAFIRQAAGGGRPWCCFASVVEPHDPFICDEPTYAMYDVESPPPPPGYDDTLADKPGQYRKARRAFAGMSPRQLREAQACYYAMITDADRQLGRIVAALEDSGQMENTLVVLTSDHGELLGAHGLFQKNVSGFEPTYHIPMVLCGPGVARGAVADARVGLHDLCPTLLELAGAEPIVSNQSRSFVPLLRDPIGAAPQFQTGYAESFGTRHAYSHRVIWDGRWKLVWNGFDIDELYDHADDPHETRNRIDDPACATIVRRLMAQAWRTVRDTGDHALLNSGYLSLRLAPYRPGIA